MEGKMKLNDRSIRALKPRAGRYEEWISGYKGLGVRVSPEGTKSWIVMYRHGGRLRRMTLGRYPAVTVARVGTLHGEVQERLDKGIDPAREAIGIRQEEQVAAKEKVFRVVYEAFAADHLAGLRTGEEIKRKFEMDVLPQWGRRRVDQITRTDVKEMIRDKAKGSPVAANRLLAALRKFFNWCADEEYIQHSPAARIKPPTDERERGRDRVLAQSEVRAVWKAAEEIGHPFGTVVKALFLTGARLDEMASLRWAEVVFDDAVIRLPPARYKTKRAHVIPLVPALKDMLAELHAEDRKRVGTGPMFEHVHRSGRVGDKPPSGWSRAKKDLDLAAARVRAADQGADIDGLADAEILKRFKIPNWRLHDIRRVVATSVREAGATREGAKRMLGHVDRSVTSLYDRAEALPELRAMLTAWADRLAIIVKGGAEVVPLYKARAGE